MVIIVVNIFFGITHANSHVSTVKTKQHAHVANNSEALRRLQPLPPPQATPQRSLLTLKQCIVGACVVTLQIHTTLVTLLVSPEK